MRNAFAAAVATAFAATAASTAMAASIDFTDRSVWTGPASTTIVHGRTVSVSANPGVVNFNQNFDGAKTGVCDGFGGLLACDSDGLGVTDDEISTTPRRTETATVLFSNALKVSGFSFLDLFISRDVDEREIVEAFFNGDESTLVSFDAVQVTGGGNPGFRAVGFNPVLATSVTFRSTGTNDSLGVADFALASVDVAPVPLPAAAWMLIAGLGGIAALGRRRQAA